MSSHLSTRGYTGPARQYLTLSVVEVDGAATEELLKGKKSEKGQKRVENQDFEYTFPTNWHPNLELFFLLLKSRWIP